MDRESKERGAANMGLTDILDEDLRERVHPDTKFLSLDQALLIQILRELKKEGPEERSKPIRGFGAGTDASEPYHPF